MPDVADALLLQIFVLSLLLLCCRTCCCQAFAAVGVPEVLLMFSNHKKVKNSKSSKQNSQACVYPTLEDTVWVVENILEVHDVTVSSHIFTGNSDQKDPSH
jgi:hypothetical protein